MSTHKVKSWTYLFEAAISGMKKHDIRHKNERDYRIGDVLKLQEYDQAKGKYTGREADFLITYITSNVTPCALSGHCLDKEYCILSIDQILSGDEDDGYATSI